MIRHSSNTTNNHLVYSTHACTEVYTGDEQADHRLQLAQQDGNVLYSPDRIVELDTWAQVLRYLRMTAAS